MVRTVTCIECPNGCQVEVDYDGKEFLSVTGFLCPKGEIYAKNELTTPRRVLTTTVKTCDGRVVPVKSSKPILKENMFAIMKVVNSFTAKTPFNLGEVIIANVEDGIDIIAAKSSK